MVNINITDEGQMDIMGVLRQCFEIDMSLRLVFCSRDAQFQSNHKETDKSIMNNVLFKENKSRLPQKTEAVAEMFQIRD